MIFVFGSNQVGIHGAGAALFAAKNHGARRGIGEGRSGNSYAIPTRNGNFRTLSLPIIREYVERFMKYAEANSSLEFQVTRIGTGYAGLADSDMARMFLAAPANCFFDSAWKPWLIGKNFWGTF